MRATGGYKRKHSAIVYSELLEKIQNRGTTLAWSTLFHRPGKGKRSLIWQSSYGGIFSTPSVTSNWARNADKIWSITRFQAMDKLIHNFKREHVKTDTNLGNILGRVVLHYGVPILVVLLTNRPIWERVIYQIIWFTIFSMRCKQLWLTCFALFYLNVKIHSSPFQD